MKNNPVSAIAGAIEEITALFREWRKGANVRRMRRAIEYSEKIIRRYERITKKDDMDRTIEKYIKAFFKYNN